MELQRQISRRLYQEHVTVLELLGTFGRALGRLGAAPPAASDSAWSVLLGQVAGALQHEVTRHFQLEEEQLFPRLQARGEGDLTELLLEEHAVIREVSRTLQPLLAKARGGALDAAGWRALKANGLELVERLSSHAEKEQGALVPLVDEILDEATDREIAAAYVD
jgi:iron-sulfur cluster repair protein YtfE (RIC family)